MYQVCWVVHFSVQSCVFRVLSLCAIFVVIEVVFFAPEDDFLNIQEILKLEKKTQLLSS